MSTQNTKVASNSSRRWRWLGALGAVALTAGVVYGTYWAQVLRYRQSTDDAYVGGNVVQITPQISGTVRLGSPDDYAFAYLPPILKRFAETHPAVQVDVVCSPSSELMNRIKAGELDLTLVSNGHSLPDYHEVPLWRGPLVWVTSTRYSPHRQDPLPLALARLITPLKNSWVTPNTLTTARLGVGLAAAAAFLPGTSHCPRALRKPCLPP